MNKIFTREKRVGLLTDNVNTNQTKNSDRLLFHYMIPGNSDILLLILSI